MTPEILEDREAFEPSWNDEPVLRDIIAAVGMLAFAGFLAAVLCLGMTVPVLGIGSVGVVGGTILLHEGVHGLAGRLLGCQVTFGKSLGGLGDTVAYAVSAWKWKTRREQAVITLAPLVLVNLAAFGIIIGVGLMTVPGLVAAIVACYNTFGSSKSDMRRIFKLRQLSREVEIYDEPDQTRTYSRPRTHAD